MSKKEAAGKYFKLGEQIDIIKKITKELLQITTNKELNPKDADAYYNRGTAKDLT